MENEDFRSVSFLGSEPTLDVDDLVVAAIPMFDVLSREVLEESLGFRVIPRDFDKIIGPDVKTDLLVVGGVDGPHRAHWGKGDYSKLQYPIHGPGDVFERSAIDFYNEFFRVREKS